MRIVVIGSGQVGRSLASGLARIGEDVAVESRDPAAEGVSSWSAQAGIPVFGPGAAIADADVVVLAVPGRVLTGLLPSLGEGPRAGTVVIDPTNPVVFTQTETRSAFAEEDSAAEHVQRTWPHARVVKAFSQIPAAEMGSPEGGGSMPVRICGDDEHAKAVVSDLARRLGWATVRDLGGLERARTLEHAAIDWMARRRGA